MGISGLVSLLRPWSWAAASVRQRWSVCVDSQTRPTQQVTRERQRAGHRLRLEQLIPAPSEVPKTRGREAARRHATLSRAIRLFREFRYEQPDPARFYTALAEDSVAQLSAYADLDGATLLDVGGGPGYFRDAFMAAGATYLGLDADVG